MHFCSSKARTFRFLGTAVVSSAIGSFPQLLSSLSSYVLEGLSKCCYSNAAQTAYELHSWQPIPPLGPLFILLCGDLSSFKQVQPTTQACFLDWALPSSTVYRANAYIFCFGRSFLFPTGFEYKAKPICLNYLFFSWVSNISVPNHNW